MASRMMEVAVAPFQTAGSRGARRGAAPSGSPSSGIPESIAQPSRLTERCDGNVGGRRWVFKRRMELRGAIRDLELIWAAFGALGKSRIAGCLCQSVRTVPRGQRKSPEHEKFQPVPIDLKILRPREPTPLEISPYRRRRCRIVSSRSAGDLRRYSKKLFSAESTRVKYSRGDARRTGGQSYPPSCLHDLRYGVGCGTPSSCFQLS